MSIFGIYNACTLHVHATYVYVHLKKPFVRYLSLFGDHIVPAVLYRYTQVLRREDLVNTKGKPLVTVARLEAVWKRLADRFATVVTDTSMITLSPEYAAHFHDIYIDGKEHAKMTGDRMKMLMLTLSFLVRDLIAPAIDTAKRGTRLHGLPHVFDPSDEVVDHTSTYVCVLVCTCINCVSCAACPHRENQDCGQLVQ